MATELLKDSSVQKAMRASINKSFKCLAGDLITQNEKLRELVSKQKEEAAQAKGKMAVVEAKLAETEAELAGLKAKRSPTELKGSATGFYNKLLLSHTFGDEFNNLARLTNQAWGHEVFESLQEFLPPDEIEHYAKYYYNPGARKSYEEAVHNFRRGGIEKLNPSVLGFLQSHADFPSAVEIDNYADDLDSKLLGEFIFANPESPRQEERATGQANHDEERVVQEEEAYVNNEEERVVQEKEAQVNNEEERVVQEEEEEARANTDV